MTERPGGSKGIAFTNWLVNKAAGVLERKSSRRGFILGSAMVGSAVAVAGCAPGTQPGTPYNHITDCGGGLCTDGYTEFCCTINNGLNACPPDSFIGGWWRADYSSFCNGTRYYMDCMQFCCGPNLGNGFCAGCTECRCAGGCDTRRVYCNYFRYGQCHQEIGITGPIACRVVTCVPPYTVADYACSTAAAVDNSTAEHAPAHPCPPPVPPFVSAAVLPMMGAATANGSGRVGVFGRRWASNVTYAEFNGSTWGPTIDLGGSVSSGVAAVVDPSGLYAFARGTGNNQLWYQRRSGSGWPGGWTSLEGTLLSDPAAVSDPAGVFVFVRGGDDAIWYQRAQSGAFAPDFTSLGGKIDSDPVAARDSTGVYVFARGPYGAVYYRRFSGGSWSGWQGMGGSATSDPWAVSDPAGLFVFVRGGGNSLYWGRFTGGAWSGWQPLDGVLSSDPFAVSTSTGPYVFARGGDNATWFRRFTGGSWTPWDTLGGATVAGPVAAFDPASGLFVFVIGTDGALYYQRLTTAWSGWQDLGGDFAPVRGGR
jgi:hypothetical protein